MSRRFADNGLTVLAVLAVGFLATMLLRPTGLIGRHIAGASTIRSGRSAEQSWSNILAGASVVGRGGTPAIVIFSDYECPYCRAEHEVVEHLLDERAGVSIAVRHFPLAIHEHAFSGAVAAVCASRAGHFATMDNLLYTTTSWMERADWGQLGIQAGIRDTTSFKACMASDAAAAAVKRDMTLGTRLQITGTPTFVSRYVIAAGALPRRTLDSLIDNGLQISRP